MAMDMKNKKKERLDVLVVKRGLAESREKAKALIMAGNIFVRDQREDKAGSTFPEDVPIELRGKTMKYVSRGGYKLEKAIELWQIPLGNQICMDVGSSTGGFTDCMLQNGADKVYAVDVGTNQLAWKLRQDDRVVSMEKTNIRYVTQNEIPEEIAFASIDVAFISLTKVLMPVWNLMAGKGRLVCLVKPQFEAGREKVGKKGVVRDQNVHKEVLENIMVFALAMGFRILALSFSPIKGPEGNIEYLLYLEKPEQAEKISGSHGTEQESEQEVTTVESMDRAKKCLEQEYRMEIQEVVQAAHTALD